MSKTIELTDEQYAAISSVASQRGQSPELLIAEVAEELRDPERSPRHFETDEWLRHLGVSEDRIWLANDRVARSEAGAVPAHPDARERYLGGKTTMIKTIELADDQYAAIPSAARLPGQTPARLIAELAEELCAPEHAPPYYDTDGWFRHPGMIDEEIAQIKEEVRQEAESIADACCAMRVISGFFASTRKGLP